MKHMMIILAIFCSGVLALAESPATKPAEPVKVTYVLDATGSMGSSFESARDELTAALAELPADKQFAVYVDHEKGATRFPAKGFAKSTDENKAAASKAIAGVKASGMGTIEATVAAACKDKPEKIWLITDGDWSILNGQSEGDKMIAAAKSAGVKLFTTYAYDKDMLPNRRRLANVAIETGGECYDKKGKPVTEVPKTATAATKPARKGPSIFSEK